MPLDTLTGLLADDQFLNYCFERDTAAVRYWEQRLASATPAERQLIVQARATALLLGAEAARHEATAQYQLLAARLAPPPAPAGPLPWRRHFRHRAATWGLGLATATAGVVGAYWYATQRPAAGQLATHAADVKPGGYRAVLTLADGRRVPLNLNSQGQLAQQAGVTVAQAAGQLTYRVSAAAGHPTGYNTLETPPKGQFEVQLPDGSRVWLNAQSRLRYPLAFAADSTRRVQLTGEAYFEIAHRTLPGGQRQPFVVEATPAPGDARRQRVEVLGTHFNVSSYADEPQAVTTLLEGRVRASTSAGAAYVLAPGQQLRVGPQGARLEKADTDAAVAWKNGDFVFHTELHQALRQVARWYGVEIVYTPSAPAQLQLGGWISRQKNLSEVLHLLEATGEVHFQVEGRKVLVSR